MRGVTKCYVHGGPSPKGIASGTFKTGRYSKYLPTRLHETYTAALNDDKFLELHDEIALVQSRAQDLIQRVDSGESGHLWKQLGKTYSDLQHAQAQHDALKMAECLTELGLLIQRGTADYAAWEDLGKQIDRKQRLVESERKRAVELQQTLTAQQAMLLFQAIFSAITKHVTDRDTRAAIQADFTAIAGPTGAGLVGTQPNGTA